MPTEGDWKPGLGGLKKVDRNRIAPADTRLCQRSIDLDQTYAAAEPNANRWDYLIAYEKAIYAIEVHEATAGEAKVVIAKGAWLRSKVAAGNLPKPQEPLLWVPTNKQSINPLSSASRQLAQHGIRTTGRVCALPWG